jgi:rhodanese-related sulfurtransferase
MQDIVSFIQHHWALNLAFFAVLFVLIVLEFINQKRNAVRISPAQATRLMNDGKTTVVDVRDRPAFDQGHIIGSVSIPASEVLQSKKLEKLKSRPIVMVCATGAESTRLATQLLKQDFNMQVLAGGIQAWSTANMPLTKE